RTQAHGRVPTLPSAILVLIRPTPLHHSPVAVVGGGVKTKKTRKSVKTKKTRKSAKTMKTPKNARAKRTLKSVKTKKTRKSVAVVDLVAEIAVVTVCVTSSGVLSRLSSAGNREFASWVATQFRLRLCSELFPR